MSYAKWEIWAIILALGVGTFVMRYSFLGILGGRELPPWLLRHLRYTAVAILPGMVAPLVIWPSGTGGAFDVPRFAAACATLLAGMLSRNTVISILAGGITLYSLLAMLG